MGVTVIVYSQLPITLKFLRATSIMRDQKMTH